jgi:hypothetical protein
MTTVRFPYAVQVAQVFFNELMYTQKWDHLFKDVPLFDDKWTAKKLPREIVDWSGVSEIYWEDPKKSPANRRDVLFRLSVEFDAQVSITLHKIDQDWVATSFAVFFEKQDKPLVSPPILIKAKE